MFWEYVIINCFFSEFPEWERIFPEYVMLGILYDGQPCRVGCLGALARKYRYCEQAKCRKQLTCIRAYCVYRYILLCLCVFIPIFNYMEEDQGSYLVLSNGRSARRTIELCCWILFRMYFKQYNFCDSLILSVNVLRVKQFTGRWIGCMVSLWCLVVCPVFWRILVKVMFFMLYGIVVTPIMFAFCPFFVQIIRCSSHTYCD